MRSLVVCLFAALLLTGCVTREGGTPVGPEREPLDLAVPIELRPVLADGSTDPSALELTTEEGERLRLTEPILTIHRLDHAEVGLQQSAWVLTLDLDDADGRAFGEWTADHVGERLAMVADEEILMAPQIQAAITGGEIQIAGDYTRDEAEDLLGRITGR